MRENFFGLGRVHSIHGGKEVNYSVFYWLLRLLFSVTEALWRKKFFIEATAKGRQNCCFVNKQTKVIVFLKVKRKRNCQKNPIIYCGNLCNGAENKTTQYFCTHLFNRTNNKRRPHENWLQHVNLIWRWLNEVDAYMSMCRLRWFAIYESLRC